MNYKTAKEQLVSGNIKNTKWFKEHGYLLEYGYSLILSGHAQEASEILQKISSQDPRANWLIKIIPILLGEKPIEEPSFLQIRCFLEIDLYMLLEVKQLEYAKNILNNGKYFFSICMECYKFMGRALYYQNAHEMALKYLLFAKDNFFKDAELHYLLGKLYYDLKDKEKSKHYLNLCLKYVPEYKPALKILENLKSI